MLLKLINDEQVYELNVPEAMMEKAANFFNMMDQDMDKGWQLNREWIQNLDQLQRCKIAADKLVTALENENHNLGRLMAGYILSRLPGVESVEPDVSGEIDNTVFLFSDQAQPVTFGTIQQPSTTSHDPALVEQANKEISQPIKVGRQWRFSILDPLTGKWEQSPAIANEQQASNLREQALRQRIQELSAKSVD